MSSQKPASQTSSQRAAAAVIYIIAIVLLAVPVIEWVANAAPFYADPYDLALGLFNLPGRLFALVGFTLMFYQFILGVRIPALERVFSRATNLKRHQTLGKVGFILIVLHGIAILSYDWVLAGQFLFDLYRVLGMIALALLIIGVIPAWYFKKLKLPRKVWKTLHLSAYVVFPLGFFHARNLGTELATSWMVEGLFTILFVVFCLIVLFRLYTLAVRK